MRISLICLVTRTMASISEKLLLTSFPSFAAGARSGIHIDRRYPPATTVVLKRLKYRLAAVISICFPRFSCPFVYINNSCPSLCAFRRLFNRTTKSWRRQICLTRHEDKGKNGIQFVNDVGKPLSNLMIVISTAKVYRSNSKPPRIQFHHYKTRKGSSNPLPTSHVPALQRARNR